MSDMRTIHVTIDEQLLLAVDKLSQELGVTRSAFVCEALRSAVKLRRIV
jgi:metal-responsive CopG/Arc/MetJ family transcriptional regulator